MAAGASAGVTNTATAAVHDAYTGLKRLLDGRFGDRDAGQALAADETAPGVWQARIGDHLAASGAADDEQILAAARHLLVLAAPETAKEFNIKVGTNYGAVGHFAGPVSFHQAPSVPPASPAAE
ncbi:hypothetical protein [Virgisporangium aurantiacum]|uniref:hypothetical protein n=1 Tax=Virgisporangium aurantiacum TaxID=175570 RepID=UPI001EF2998E|nr:hypothetical protein [Virgisporangium aurantiacum]